MYDPMDLALEAREKGHNVLGVLEKDGKSHIICKAFNRKGYRISIETHPTSYHVHLVNKVGPSYDHMPSYRVCEMHRDLKGI